MISWDGRTRNVVIDGQPIAASSVAPFADGWVATIACGRGVDITLEADSPVVDTAVIRFWKRPASDGVGLAVIAERGEPAGLAIIAVCECGEQGCANAGRQLQEPVDAEGAVQLIDRAARLRVAGSLAQDDETWSG